MAAYPIPDWLKPADTSEAFLGAFRTGAQIAGEQAKLQAEAQQQQMALAVKEQEQQREQMHQNQVLEMTKAYHQAQVGLRQQQLEEAAKVNAMKATQAARQFAAQQAIVKQATEAGSTDEAWRQAYLMHPEAFSSAAGLTPLLKKQAGFQPGDVQGFNVLDPVSKAPMPGFVAVPGSSGMVTREIPGFNPESGARQRQLMAARQDVKDMDAIKARWAIEPPKENKRMREAWEKDQEKLRALEKHYRALIPESALDFTPGQTKGGLRYTVQRGN